MVEGRNISPAKLAPLTKTQQAVLRYIIKSIARQGYAPTLQEIADALQWPIIAVWKNVQNLVAKGYLVGKKHRCRALQVVQVPAGFAKDCHGRPETVAGIPALTPRQLVVLHVVVQWMDEHDCFPSVEWLAQTLDIRPHTAYNHLASLESKGCLGRSANGRSRVILYRPAVSPPVPRSPRSASG